MLPQGTPMLVSPDGENNFLAPLKAIHVPGSFPAHLKHLRAGGPLRACGWV